MPSLGNAHDGFPQSAAAANTVYFAPLTRKVSTMKLLTDGHVALQEIDSDSSNKEYKISPFHSCWCISIRSPSLKAESQYLQWFKCNCSQTNMEIKGVIWVSSNLRWISSRNWQSFHTFHYSPSNKHIRDSERIYIIPLEIVFHEEHMNGLRVKHIW